MDDPVPQLSPRMVMILLWTSKGMTAEQIGKRMILSASAIRFQHRQLRAALDVPNLAAAVHVGYQRGILPLPEDQGSFHPRLTGREWRLLQLLAAGQRFADAGQAMGVATSTVRCLSQQVYMRLGARTAPHAVGIAHRLRLMATCPTCEHDHGGHDVEQRTAES